MSDELNLDFIKMVQEKQKNKSVGNYKQKIAGEVYVGRNEKIKDFIGTALDIAKEQALKILPFVAGLGIGVGVVSAGLASNTYDNYKEEKNEIANEELDMLEKYNYDNYLKENNPSLKEKISIVEEINEKQDELKEDYDSKLDAILNVNKIYEEAVGQVAEEHFNDELYESRQK